MVGAIGIMPRIAAEAVSRIGRKRCAVGLDDRVPRVRALRLLLLDLVDQDHRVAGDHAGQREHAEDRHEAERLVREEQRRDDADEAHGRDAQHQEHAAEALQLDHQHRQR